MAKSTDRPKVKHTTPSGVEFEVWEYLTGRDARELQKVSLSMFQNLDNPESLSVSPDDTKAVMEIVQKNPDFVTEIQDKLIDIGVVSVDGKTTKIVDRILDLPGSDLDFIMTKLNELRDGLDSQDKKK